MKKKDLVQKLVPAVIKSWKDNSPEYNHDGKEKMLTKQFMGWNKKDIQNYLGQLETKGYVS
ncbi:hypothetical protein [Halobacillus sp. H74]|uniref:hypothetical protein n=1 Tax=Halobacillus sp. H74 TaxID=3457436 RepID=UPI003FCC6B04